MFVPEYTITPQILKNIATVEYNKAIIDNTKILPQWEKQLQKDAILKTLIEYMAYKKLPISNTSAKKFVDGIETPTGLVVNALNIIKIAYTDTSQEIETDEEMLKRLNKIIQPQTQGIYREIPLPNKPLPEEILAKVVEIFDWLNSKEALETHILVTSAILTSALLQIRPFKADNLITIYSVVNTLHKIKSYAFNNYLSTFGQLAQIKEHIEQPSEDLTTQIEEYTDIYARTTSTLKETVLILNKDTKIAKVTGRIQLTPRQERIIEYLQDYGILRNKDFKTLFPNKSEDTVLRDLKVLMNKGLIIKKGKTKSSRYELTY